MKTHFCSCTTVAGWDVSFILLVSSSNKPQAVVRYRASIGVSSRTANAAANSVQVGGLGVRFIRLNLFVVKWCLCSDRLSNDIVVRCLKNVNAILYRHLFNMGSLASAFLTNKCTGLVILRRFCVFGFASLSHKTTTVLPASDSGVKKLGFYFL